MTTEGLLNETANVFWHYDYGNQNYIRACWALLPASVSIAWYGYAPPPDDAVDVPTSVP